MELYNFGRAALPINRARQEANDVRDDFSDSWNVGRAVVLGEL